MKQEIKRYASTLAPLSTLGAFVADVLTPLGPFTKWLFIIFGLLSLINGILYFRNIDLGKKYFAPTVILTIIFGVLFFFNGDTKSGVLGDNIDSISSIQESLFNIWTGKILTKYRKNLLKGKRCDSPCKSCNAEGTLLGKNHAEKWNKIY